MRQTKYIDKEKDRQRQRYRYRKKDRETDRKIISNNVFPLSVHL
jgi:hypothetical protein